MNKQQQSYDPFGEFINTWLDMDGINGLDQGTIASKVQQILRGLPTNMTSELWNDQLDGLQSVIRVCLDLQTVAGAFGDRLDPANFNRDDMEVLIMLSVTFAFISYNQMRPSYETPEQDNSDSALLARRLRDTLQVSLGWVKRAAREGDPIANKVAQEAFDLLNLSKRLGEE